MQNPNNPYGQPPVPNQPTGTVSLDVIGQAWKLVQPNIGVWIGAAVVVTVISGIVSTLGSNIGKNSAMLGILFNLVSIAVSSFLSGGMIRMALSQIRSGRADFGQLFSAGDVVVNLIIAGLITGIISGIGIVLCIIPGLIATALFLAVNPLIVDKNMSFMDAISKSVEATKPHIGTLLILMLVLVLLNIGGMLACFVGIFVTIPISVVAVTLVYTSLFGGEGAGFSPPSNPYAPIADPRG